MTNDEKIVAIAYDTPIPGYKTHNCNVLRLWKAIPMDEINQIGRASCRERV